MNDEKLHEFIDKALVGLVGSIIILTIIFMGITSLFVSVPFLPLLGACAVAAIFVGGIGWLVTVVPIVTWKEFKNDDRYD